MRVDVDRKTEVGGQVAADLDPVVAGIIASHDVPVLLHEQDVGTRAMLRDVMHAVADLGVPIRDVVRTESAIGRLPCLTAVVGPEGAGGGDGDEHPLRIGRVQDDRVETHAASPGCPL